jgi:hypothetical protein
MKKECLTFVGVGLLVCLLPASLRAWCWVRDTGPTEADCSAGLYQEDCCDGALRKWIGNTMTYRISDSTHSSLMPLIEAGMNKWNDIEMSVFEFKRGDNTTTAVIVFDDDENTIVIDPNFCTSYADLFASGDCPYILGISSTREPSTDSGSFQALESDIALNDQSFDWDDGTEDQNTVAVIAHESGHSAGLSHPGDECLASGSSGCGAEFPKATMFWNYNGGQPTDKGSLELDDVAALVYGYPKSTLRVRVVTDEVSPQPVLGATVDLLDSAVPVNGSSIAGGGSVYGDVTNAAVLFGDGGSSPTYVNSTPFSDTNTSGETNDVNPIHETIRVRVTAGALAPVTQSHTVVAGEQTVFVTLATNETDFAGPVVAVTSHTSGQSLGAADITLAGTATDSGRGASGISQVTVNGEIADNGTAVGDGVADWSLNLSLAEGANTFTILAFDGQSTEPNSSRLTLIITYDTIPPTVTSVLPADGSAEVDVNTNLGVTFSEAIDPSTINTSTFLLDSGVTGSVVYNTSSNIALFVPSAPLASNTSYNARLTTGVRDLVGLPLAADVTWSITTGAPGSGSGGGSRGCFVGAVTSY